MLFRSPLVAQTVKNLLAMWETWVRSLGWKDPLEKGMATHSSVLAGESHGQSSLVGYSPWSCKESDTTERLTHTAEESKMVAVRGFTKSRGQSTRYKLLGNLEKYIKARNSNCFYQ